MSISLQRNATTVAHSRKSAMTKSVRVATRLGLLLAAFAGVACATVGTGTRTVIRHKSPDQFLRETYPHLVVAEDSVTAAGQIIYFDDNGNVRTDANTAQTKMREFRAFMKSTYGDPGYIPLVLQATVHDRTTVPTFSPVDYQKHLASVLLADTELSLDERRRRFTILVNQPDLHDSTTTHLYDEGIPAYRYFPRVSVDFSSSIGAASPLDRIAFLLLVVQLKLDDECARQCGNSGQEQIRFLNFSPKEADFVDFTRGQFTQAFQASTNASFGATTTESDGSNAATTQNSIGWTPSVSFSESYVSNLADAIERRSTGLLDEQTFYAAFRSLREVRIGGTYNFDLMLEVPSKKGAKSDTSGVVSYPWEPIADEVRADVYMIGIVRHVYDRGHLRSGFWGLSKVPEPENDDVYEQVVVKRVPNVLLWKSKELDWVASQDRAYRCVVEVFTNRPDATFVATDDQGDVVAIGRGTQALLRVPEAEGRCSTTITFVPIVLSGGATSELTVPAPSDEVHVEFTPKETRRVLGVYRR